MRIEPGDYEVLVNERRTGGTYADIEIAAEVAQRLHKSNFPHTITVRSISTGLTEWPSPIISVKTNQSPGIRSEPSALGTKGS
jgi:hypothetical protein